MSDTNDVTQEIEVDILTAIGNDYEAMTGTPAVVTNYLVVAEVIQEDGAAGMMWTAPDGMTPQAMLGYAHWLLKRVDEET